MFHFRPIRFIPLLLALTLLATAPAAAQTESCPGLIVQADALLAQAESALSSGDTVTAQSLIMAARALLLPCMGDAVPPTDTTTAPSPSSGLFTPITPQNSGQVAVIWTAPADAEGDTIYATGVAFTQGGAVLATGGDRGLIQYWDINGAPNTWAETARLQIEAESYVWGFDAADDGTLGMGLYETEDNVMIWRGDGPPLVFTGHTDLVTTARFYPGDSRFLATGSYDGFVVVWEGDVEVNRFQVEGDLRGVDWSPDGTLLATAADSLSLWDVASGARIAEFPANAGGELSVAFSPDGSLVATGTDDTSIYVFDVASGELVTVVDSGTGLDMGRVQAVAWSPDGAMLAAVSSGGGQTLAVIDTSDWELLPIGAGFDGRLDAIDWSPDGAMLAVGGEGTPATVWAIPLGG